MPSAKPAGGSGVGSAVLEKETGYAGEEAGTESSRPTNTLWVGNLKPETTEAEVMASFAVHEALDCVVVHPISRSYAFVMFRDAEKSIAAKNALQGSVLKGNTIRIEFSRPAKACKNIWIGGIAKNVSKEQLEEHFSKFGQIEQYVFSRERNSALIDYFKLEDAITAHKTMNGKSLNGEKLCVDFQRYQPWRTERTQHDLRSAHLSTRALAPLGRSASPHGVNMLNGGRRDDQPTNVLWIGYPPSVQIDEEMLHNAMILFGEIERITCMPARHFAFVVFRNSDEARRAKEGLQGRLFNDKRIQIQFSSSDFVGQRENVSAFPGGHPEKFGLTDPLGPNSLPAPLLSKGAFGPSHLTRPMTSKAFDARQEVPEHDYSTIHSGIADPNIYKPVPAIRRGSPSAAGILPSPNLRPTLQSSGSRDRSDMRDSKRLRVDESPEGFSEHNRRSYFEGGSSDRTLGSFVRVKGELFPQNNYCWRGVLAKGGSPVCHALCVSIGKGIDSPLSEVINCSAKTALSTLQEHFADATAFDIIFFLPASEVDFRPYTDFLDYLGERERAGVVKLDDGTTLFLVPQSSFLTDVLEVEGPKRLYGVILHYPPPVETHAQIVGSSAPYEVDETISHKSYDSLLHNKGQPYDSSSKGEVMQRLVVSRPITAPVDTVNRVQSASLNYGSSQPAPPASLTPELLASLNSLVPSNKTPAASVPLTPELLSTLNSLVSSKVQPINPIQSSNTGSVQMPSSSLMKPVSASLPSMHDGSLPVQPWLQNLQRNPLAQHPGQLFANQPVSTSHVPDVMSASARTNNLVQPTMNSMDSRNFGLPVIPNIQINAREISQTSQLPAYQNQLQYQVDSSTSYQNTHSMYLPVQQNAPMASAKPQAPQPAQNIFPFPTDKGHVGVASQSPMQIAPPATSQGSSQSDVEKNLRYQATLQKAADMLRQIQQLQRQGGAQSAQGLGNQQ